MGPVWHCDHLVCGWGTGCLFNCYGWWVLSGIVITLFANEGLVACLLLWLMGPVSHCDHLVCGWGTDCLFIMVDGSCPALWSPCLQMRDWLLVYCYGWWVLSGIVITLFADEGLVACLLWLMGPVWHCDHLVCGWGTGCLFIVIVNGSCQALWSPRLLMRDWLLVCYGWWVLSDIVITSFVDEGLAACLLLWLMGPVRHCDYLVCRWGTIVMVDGSCNHLVCGWGTGCLFIVMADGSCLALWSPCLRMRDWLLIYCYGWWVLSGIVITLFADEGLVACLLLWLMGPVSHCDHLVCGWRTGCLFIVMVDGSCLALWSPRLQMRDWLLVYCYGWWVLSGILITSFADKGLVACLIVIAYGPCLELWSPRWVRDWLLCFVGLLHVTIVYSSSRCLWLVLLCDLGSSWTPL